MTTKQIITLILVALITLVAYSALQKSQIKEPNAESILPQAKEEVIVQGGENAPQTGKDEEVFRIQEIYDAITLEDVPTPAQAEGPYYPVEKPSDSDGNLRQINDSSTMAKGTPINLYGVVSDVLGERKENLTVEIWQTDDSGIYLHPDDPRTQQRDQDFQFYGETVTATDGAFHFESILPGQYDDRPRHIHMKVKSEEGEELLTSQLYFSLDEQENDSIPEDTPNSERMIVTLTQDEAAPEYRIGIINVVLP